jgi:hypothetical protein
MKNLAAAFPSDPHRIVRNDLSNRQIGAMICFLLDLEAIHWLSSCGRILWSLSTPSFSKACISWLLRRLYVSESAGPG